MVLLSRLIAPGIRTAALPSQFGCRHIRHRFQDIPVRRVSQGRQTLRQHAVCEATCSRRDPQRSPGREMFAICSPGADGQVWLDLPNHEKSPVAAGFYLQWAILGSNQ